MQRELRGSGSAAAARALHGPRAEFNKNSIRISRGSVRSRDVELGRAGGRESLRARGAGGGHLGLTPGGWRHGGGVDV